MTLEWRTLKKKRGTHYSDYRDIKESTIELITKLKQMRLTEFALLRSTSVYEKESSVINKTNQPIEFKIMWEFIVK